MDAVIENVRNSFEVGVRKMWTGGPKKGDLMTPSENYQFTSKIFGASLCDICEREEQTVPFIVKDICTFIRNHHIDREGIFRLSSSSVQASKLRDAFEQFNPQKQLDLCSNLGVDVHVAANVLKQFFRQLNKPLIPDEVLKLSKELKCVSDERFATSVRSLMNSWSTPHRCTLQYLLSFLQLVMRNIENRMTVTGLAVVFGPNIFRISGGIEGLEIQGLANQTVERLLLSSDIICDHLKDDQGYLNMEPPNSLLIKPARMAPPVPMKARPLPPPPVPAHTDADVTAQFVASLPVPSAASPPVPTRSISLKRSLVLDEFERDSFDACATNGVKYPTAESELSAQVANESNDNPGKEIVDKTIRHVVRKHLFSAESPSQCSRGSTDFVSHDSGDDATTMTLLPSLTAGRVRGPKNRRKPSKRARMTMDVSSSSEFVISDYEEPAAPVPMPRKSVKVNAVVVTTDPVVKTGDSHALADTVGINQSAVIVTTPDSGCLTAEDDFSHVQTDFKNAVFVPKLNLAEAVEEDKFGDVTEVVPPLDLSEVTQFDEVIQPLPQQQKVTPTKTKKRRKKGTKSTSHHRRISPKPPSEPIDIPVSHIPAHVHDDDVTTDSSTNGSSRWRDAWSTDEETVPMATALENNLRHDVRYPVETEDIEVAPSSPENHFPRHHHHVAHHHHHHSHHHRHHHDNHINRPKLSNSLKEASAENFEEIFSSLRDVMESLDINRKQNERPEDLTLMTREQIRLEKIAMQRELLKHEGRHGRPASKQEKEIMREVYDRYRTVKRLLADTMSPPFNTHHPHRRLDDVEHDYDVNLIQHNDEFAVTQLVTLAPPEWKKRHQATEYTEIKDHVSADLGISELRKQQREAKGQKKRLRRKLRDFEREIEQQHGRPMNQADRVVMATEYSEYRDLKAKLRLLEALIEKHDAQHRSL